MTEQKDVPSVSSPDTQGKKTSPDDKKISRRGFLIGAGLVGGSLAASKVKGLPSFSENSSKDANAVTSAENQNAPEFITSREEIQNVRFEPYRSTPAKPLEKNGMYYDLHSRSYTNAENATEDMHVLAEGDIFPWRDSEIRPDVFYETDVYKQIVSEVDENLARWRQKAEEYEEKRRRGENDAGKINPDHPVLIAGQIQRVVSKYFTYNRLKPVEHSDKSLEERIAEGATNCQEYTLATAGLLSQYGIKSDVIHFGYKLEDRNVWHVANVIDIDNTCVIVESVGNAVLNSFGDYYKNTLRNSEGVTPIVQYTSVMADDYKSNFQWDNRDWTMNQTAKLGMNAYYSAS